MEQKRLAVLDIGGTSIKAGEYINGNLVNVKEYDTNAKEGGKKVMENAISILKTMKDYEGIGISTAGQVDSVQGMIRYANSNIPGYTGMRVKDILEKEFGVPVTVENDVNAAALGEAAFGAGREYNDFLCLTYGTGVGGAIVMNKKIYTGCAFSAGEMGGLLVHASQRNAKEDLFSGCYERYASTTALVRMAKEKDETLINGREIFKRMDEPMVKEVIDAWIMEIVYGLTSLIHIFNPPCVVLGGGVMEQSYVLEEIQKRIYENTMESFHDVKICKAQLGNKAGLLGAVQNITQHLSK